MLYVLFRLGNSQVAAYRDRLFGRAICITNSFADAKRYIIENIDPFASFKEVK